MAEQQELLPCGHPKSSLYIGKFTVESGECIDCGAEYVKEQSEKHSNCFCPNEFYQDCPSSGSICVVCKRLVA